MNKGTFIISSAMVLMALLFLLFLHGTEKADVYSTMYKYHDDLNQGRYNKLQSRLTTLVEQAKSKPSYANEKSVREAMLMLTHPDPGHEANLNMWVESFPNSAIPHLVRGRYYYSVALAWRGEDLMANTSLTQRENYYRYSEKASADLMRSLELDDKIAETYRQLVLLASSGKSPDKEFILERGLAVLPASFYIRQAYMARLQPKWGGSVEKIRAFIEDTKSYIDQTPELTSLLGYEHYNKASILYYDGIYEEALDELNKAIAIGNNVDYSWRRISIYKSLERYDEMIPMLKQHLETYPADPAAIKELGYRYMHAGQFDKAEPYTKLAADLSPYRYQMELRLGWYYLNTKDYENAVQAYKRALYYVPVGGARAWHMLAEIYDEHMHEHDKSLYAYKRALNLTPTSPDLWLDYGFLLSKTKSCDLMAASYLHLELCKSEHKDHSCTQQYFERDRAILSALVNEGLCPPIEEYFKTHDPLKIERIMDL